MTPDVLAVSFEGAVRAAITQRCPGISTHYATFGEVPHGPICSLCDGSGRVSALSILTLPESPLHLDLQRSGPISLPFTLGLVLGEFDEGAAARIEADTGWQVRWVPGRTHRRPAVLVADEQGHGLRFLPVGHLVATARVTDVHPYTDLGADHDEAYCCEGVAGTAQHDYGLWHWRLAGVAVVDDPPPVTAPADRTVWVP